MDKSNLLDGHFSGGRNLTGSGPGTLVDLLNNWRLKNTGAIASAITAAWGGQPSDGDSVTIGGHIYEFSTDSPPTPAAATRTGVTIGASLAESLANLAQAVNGRPDTSIIAPGTATRPVVFADVVNDQQLRVQYADEAGGNPIAGEASSLTLAKSGANIGAWNISNLNIGGGAAPLNNAFIGSLTVAAGHISASPFFQHLPFVPTVVIPLGVTSGGVRVDTDDKVEPHEGGVKFTFGGGAAPNLQVGDIVSYIALG